MKHARIKQLFYIIFPVLYVIALSFIYPMVLNNALITGNFNTADAIQISEHGVIAIYLIFLSKTHIFEHNKVNLTLTSAISIILLVFLVLLSRGIVLPFVYENIIHVNIPIALFVVGIAANYVYSIFVQEEKILNKSSLKR